MKKSATRLWEKLGIAFVCLAVVVLLIGGLRSCARQLTATGPYSQNLQGRVVNKFIQTHEGYEGSSFSYRLLIKGKPGHLMRVPVTATVYEQAEAGLWFERNAQGSFILTDEPRTGPLPSPLPAIHAPLE